MNPKDIIEVVPHILMYFIPGYIALSIKKKNRQEHKHDDKEAIILSIKYSFIISIVAFIGSKIISYFGIKFEHGSILTLNEITEWNILFNFIISYLVGYAISIFPDMRINKRIRRFFKVNSEPYSSVWNYAMKSPNGAWAIVYLDESDIGYVGSLINYTCNPDSELREVLLSKYISFKISNSEEIENKSTDEDALVLINASDIKRIEILKEKIINDYINYNEELNKLLDNENIWSSNFKDISESDINNVNTAIKQMDKTTLKRISSILKDYRYDIFEYGNIYLGFTTVSIAISTLLVTVDVIYGLFAFIIYAFLQLIFGIYLIKFRIPNSRKKNSKVKCIEIAIKEILNESNEE